MSHSDSFRGDSFFLRACSGIGFEPKARKFYSRQGKICSRMRVIRRPVLNGITLDEIKFAGCRPKSNSRTSSKLNFGFSRQHAAKLAFVFFISILRPKSRKSTYENMRKSNFLHLLVCTALLLPNKSPHIACHHRQSEVEQDILVHQGKDE